MKTGQTFKDNLGHQFEIALTIPKVRRLSQALDLDLMDADDFQTVMGSRTDQLSVVMFLCGEQAHAIGLSPDEFEERLVGDTIADGAVDALLLACADLFERYGQQALAMMARKQVETLHGAREQLNAMIDSGEWDSILEQQKAAVLRGMNPLPITE